MSSVKVCIVNKSLYKNDNCQNIYPHKELLIVKVSGVGGLNFQDDIVIELKTDGRTRFIFEKSFDSGSSYSTTIWGNYLRISCTEKGKSEIDLGEYFCEVQQGSTRNFGIRVLIDSKEIGGNVDNIDFDGSIAWEGAFG